MRYREILEAATRAPSGDNCQPWRFEVRGDEIRILNLPERDTSLFNHKQRASLVAHGALIENLLIAASALGFSAELALSPDSRHPDCVASVVLRQGSSQDEPLYHFIDQRCTNRRRYESAPLGGDERIALQAAAEGVSGRLILTGSDQDKAFLSEIVALNDRLVFENEHLHAFLFEHIRWDDHEARETRDGLDVKTLDLAPPDALAFPILRRWPLVKFLNAFGMSRVVAGNARKLASSASALGLIVVPGNEATDYLNAGRLMERAWLEATRLGLSFQLMTGITFLMGKVLDGDTAGLSQSHSALIVDAHRRVSDRFGTGSETIAVMFRVGRSHPPSARSLRLPLDSLATTVG